MKRKTRGNKMENIICGGCGVMLLWFLLSWADVVAHNMTDQCYAWWNLFEIIFR